MVVQSGAYSASLWLYMLILHSAALEIMQLEHDASVVRPFEQVRMLTSVLHASVDIL